MKLDTETNTAKLSAQEKIALLKKQLSEKANKEKITYALSYGQKALYFLYMNSPESPAYNVAFTVRIISKPDTEALKKTFQKLINRHPSLRTNYKLADGIPVQEVSGYKSVSFEITDVSKLNDQQLKALVKKTNEIPFDLENDDLIKVYLFKASDENYVMLISMHHIVSDGWSIGIMFDEIKELYEAECDGKQITLPPLSMNYSDYVKAQQDFIQGNEGAQQLDHWKNELSGGLPVLNLPEDHQRPQIQTYNGATEYFTLRKDLIDKLKKLSQSEGTTLFATLLSAYQIFLHRYTGQEDVITGIPTAGRKTEFEKITGYFINPVSIRTDSSDDPLLKNFIGKVKKKILNGISNQDYPFPLLVEKMLQKRDPTRSPVFQTFFGLQKVQHNDVMQEMLVPNNTGEKVLWGKLTLEAYDISQQEGQFDLTVEFVEGKRIFSCAFKYNKDLFERDTIIRMTGHFTNLLEDIADNPGKRISQLEILSAKEKNLMLNEWNKTDFTFENFRCVHKLIEEQTIKTPDATAVVFKDQKLTYDELNKSANRLANYLIKHGVTKETFVGLCIERSPEMIIAILAVLKTGAAYIPIDTSYPQSRIEFMISDSKAGVIISQESVKDNLPPGISKTIFIDKDRKKISNENDSNIDADVSLNEVAYVIYTSGSTGTPKGVMIEHKSLSNHMMWMTHRFGFDSTDSVLQKTPFSFDASVWEFYLPLITGGKLVIAKPEGHMDISYLIDTIIKNNITTIQLVPTLLRMLLDENGIENCTSLKAVFCGGEALTYELKEKLFDKLDVKFYNFYGPTEVTIDSVYYECKKEDNNIPIGKPVYNTQAYIVDKFLNPVPIGVAGELLLGGIDVGRGYLNNKELTDDKFIKDIFRKRDTKLYKTGDLVKYRSDGNIDYLGRVDRQVKLRGYRIELEEIESKLTQNDAVKNCAVIVREDKPGSQKLVAYIVNDDKGKLSLNELKNDLRKSLPEYMIPNAFVFLDKIPMLPNGKTDRSSLPVPDAPALSDDNFAEAKLPVEKILSDIWKQILGLEKIGINDNFFELGGDSIISIQIISKANQSGIKITPKQIFQYQTIAELSLVAELVKEQNSDQGMVTGELPLTPVQHWFFERDLPEPQHYNHSVLLKVPKGLNSIYLKDALKEIISHHDALRLTFKIEDGKYSQFNAGISEDIPFYTEEAQDNDSLQSIIQKYQTSIDLSKAPLIKVVLFKIKDSEVDRLLIIVHHLCIDGISWRILLEDLYNVYISLNAGKKFKLSAKTDSFKDWSIRINELADTDGINNEKDHLLSLSNFNFKDIPLDIENGKKLNTIDSAETIRIDIEEALTQSLLKEVPKAYNTQINDILLAALSMAYAEWSCEKRMLISLEGHGREEIFETSDVSRTIGWFTSMFPVMLEVSDKNDAGELIKSTKEKLRSIPSNGIGFGMLRYNCSDDKIRNDIKNINIPEIIFNYLGQFSESIATGSDWKFGKDAIILDQNKQGQRSHLMEINAMIIDNKLKMEFTYSKNFHKEETIITFANLYKNSLIRIIQHCTETDSGGFTPSDFSAAGLDQQELDNLLSNLN
ncbi:MAG: amino acid adenylation domain-containing protein [bacterium]